MRDNGHKNADRFASNGYSSELKSILKAFEELCAEKYEVEKLIKVLKPQAGPSGMVSGSNQVKRTVHLPPCIVVTSLKVL